MTKIFSKLYQFQHQILAKFSEFRDVSLLLSRMYIAQVFFTSGLTKIKNWDNTLFLFNEEYQVPLFPPEMAAWFGTAGELILPVLLLLGVFARFSALGLTVVNVFAFLSLVEVPAAAQMQHILWGCLLIFVLIEGGGKFALDSKMLRRFS